MSGADRDEIAFVLGLMSKAELAQTVRRLGCAANGDKAEVVARLTPVVRGELVELMRSTGAGAELWRQRIRRGAAREVGPTYANMAEAVRAHVAWTRRGGIAIEDLAVPRSGIEQVATAGAPPRPLLEHQEAALAAIAQKIRVGSGGFLCLPTGGGKTETAVRWLLQYPIANGARVLWLAGRTELIAQTIQAVRRCASLLHGRPSSFSLRTVTEGAPAALDGDLVVASIQTLKDRLKANPGALDATGHVPVIIYDEAHHAAAPTYRDMLHGLGLSHRMLLGLTATPIRSSADDKRHLDAMFSGGIYHEATYLELMEREILARPIRVLHTRQGAVEMTPEDIAHVRQWGDFGPKLLGRLASNDARSREVAEQVNKYWDDLRPFLVFAIGTTDARRIQRLLRDQHNRTVEYIDASTPPRERARILQDLGRADGTLDGVVNVQVLTEGTDIAMLKGVVIARPVASETLYRQMFGRGSRGRRVGGTPTFVAFDFRDDFAQFGDILASRFALEAELPSAIAAPEQSPGHHHRAGATGSRAPAVLGQLRALVAELQLARPGLDVTKLQIAGWWTWIDESVGAPEYLLAFTHEVDEVGGYVERATAASAYNVWISRLFGRTAVPWNAFKSLAAAKTRGGAVTYVPLRPLANDELSALAEHATAAADTEGWLRQQYEDQAGTGWPLYYPTLERFREAVAKAAEAHYAEDAGRATLPGPPPQFT
jgi:superfamily II DNA or RNA helicase